MSSSSDFLATLPLLPLSNVIEKLTVQDLVNVAFENEPMQEFIKYIGISSGGFNVSFDEFGMHIQMVNQDFNFHWYGKNPSDVINVFYEKFNEFNGTFPGAINQLNVCPMIFEKHFDQLPRVCNVLSIGKEADNYTEEDLEYMDVCSESTLDALLNQIDFKKALSLNGPMEVRTENEKVFKVDSLKVNNSGWMDASILSRLQNKSIQLAESSLLEDDVNNFLQNLKEGTGNNNLNVMTIQKEGGWSVDRVVRGLEATVAEKQLYVMDADLLRYFGDRTYQDGKFLSGTRDFVRSDGAKVSVDVIMSTLRIHVWHSETKESVSRKRASDELNGPVPKKQRL